MDNKLDAKLDLRFKKFREDFKGEICGEIISEMHSIFEQYFPPPSVTVHGGASDRGKGVLGTPPPGFQSRENFVISPMKDFGQLVLNLELVLEKAWEGDFK